MSAKLEEFIGQAQNYIDGDDMAIDPFLLEDIVDYLKKQITKKIRRVGKHNLTDYDLRKMKEIGIPRSTFYGRRKAGWSKEKAMTTPPEQRNDRKKYIELAAKNGINKRTFLTRVNRLGWDIEKAVTQPVRKKKNMAARAMEVDVNNKNEEWF